VLVVEDDDAIRENLRLLLESEGYHVEAAEHGGEALHWLRSAPVLPQLILLDLMMPVMDGYHFRLEQGQDAKLSKIPVVVISAGGNIEIQKLKLGPESVLKKPFEIDDLLRVVNKALAPA
jgi:CheY-like chemotaxis protein